MIEKRMDKNYDRRQFLKFTGTCALAALVGSGCTLAKPKAATEALQTCPYDMTYDPYPGQCINYVDNSGSGYCDYSEPENLADAAQQAASEPIATGEPEVVQPTQAPTATAPANNSASELVVLCHRNCSYPGHCRRFRDNDNSGICDLSEGIDPSEL
jgi:hypothetical protein